MSENGDPAGELTASRDSSTATGEQAKLAWDDPRHGTPNGYNNLGCRCAACRAAWAEYEPRRAAVSRWRVKAGITRPRQPTNEPETPN